MRRLRAGVFFLRVLRQPFGVHREAGAPERVMARYLRDHDIPLAVVGTKGRSGVADLLLGSAAAKLLDWLPADVLLVRRPPA